MGVQTTEKETLARLNRGDKQAFEALFRSWYGPMVIYALRIIPDRMEAESVVQSVFLNVWERRGTLKIDSLNNYLKVAVRNRCMNYLRNERKQGFGGELFEPAADTHDEEWPTPELLGKLRQAIDQMPPQRQKIFRMSRFEGYKYKDIARQLGLSPKTVEAQMGKALKYLRGVFAGSAANSETRI